MAEPQLFVLSAKARDLAHRLARRENRSIADMVKRAHGPCSSPIPTRAKTGHFTSYKLRTLHELATIALAARWPASRLAVNCGGLPGIRRPRISIRIAIYV